MNSLLRTNSFIILLLWSSFPFSTFAFLCSEASAFCRPVKLPFSRSHDGNQDMAAPFVPGRTSTSLALSQSNTGGDGDNGSGLLDELRRKSIKELKKELTEKRIRSDDVFEKEQLVQRLYKATLEPESSDLPPLNEDHRTSTASSSSSSSSTRANNQQQQQPPKTSRNSGADPLVTPLKLISLRGDREIEVDSSDVEPGELKFKPIDQPFATMELQVLDNNNKQQYTLNLMVDTACSGVVLKSSSVQKYQMKLMSNPVTSTGASGQAEQVALTELPTFTIGGETFNSRLPAAVQDLTVLPNSIDGIIGLSFLNQFDTIEFDYTSQVLKLYKNHNSVPNIPKMGDSDGSSSSGVVTTVGDLKMLGSLGVYTVDVYIGDRGPVSMIVDSGGSNTFLSWKGLRDLGLRRDSKGVYQIPANELTGAMGNTGQAFALTHRIYVSSQLKLVQQQQQLVQGKSPSSGLDLSGKNRLNIDIGDIPLLQSLESQNVGGILGLDVFTRCSAIRLKLQGNERTLTLLSDKSIN